MQFPEVVYTRGVVLKPALAIVEIFPIVASFAIEWDFSRDFIGVWLDTLSIYILIFDMKCSFLKYKLSDYEQLEYIFFNKKMKFELKKSWFYLS